MTRVHYACCFLTCFSGWILPLFSQETAPINVMQSSLKAESSNFSVKEFSIVPRADTSSCKRWFFELKPIRNRHQAASVQWIFGDVSHRKLSQNVLEVIDNIFETPGHYEILALVSSHQGTVVFTNSITVPDTKNFSVAGKSTLCINEKSLLVAKGAGNYVWNRKSGTDTFMVLPETQSISVRARFTDFGCWETKDIIIQRSECRLYEAGAEYDYPLQVSPLEAHDNVGISFSINMPLGAYSIVDISGRTMKKGKIKGLYHRISLPQMQPGLYFIQLKFSEVIKMVKIHVI
jgi:hypothetical protein